MKKSSSTSKLRILQVDDDPDQLSAWKAAISATGARIAVLHPEDVTESDLEKASLVLVDFKLEDWPKKPLPLARAPSNGLALAAVLQEAAFRLDPTKPRAFALFTGVMTDVARGLVHQPHIVARARGLEWIFQKGKRETPAQVEHVVQLASAVNSLPKPWPGESHSDARDALEKWLKIPAKALWRDAAWEGVLACHPPIHEYGGHTHGLSVLRWALQRVLPYPTFLLNDHYLAARLRIKLSSLQREFERSAKLRKLLQPAQYAGELRTFSGRRWWRSAVDSIAFDLARAQPTSIQTLHQNLKKIAPKLVTLGNEAVFPVMNTEFEFQDELLTAPSVVEIIPDDWPPFADSAWAAKTEFDEQPALQAIAARPDEAIDA